MADRYAHQVAGAVASVAAVSIDRPGQAGALHHPILAGTAGAMLGKLPDILEPSLNNPHHRQFFHSFVVLGGLAYGIKQLYEWEPDHHVDKALRSIGIVACAAYLSHLILDGCTPRSLPILGEL